MSAENLLSALAADIGSEAAVKAMNVLASNVTEVLDWLRDEHILRRTNWSLELVGRDPDLEWWEAGYVPRGTTQVKWSVEGEKASPLFTVSETGQ
jgi:hypothetical protein